ncbi:MAG: hypothetical protein ABIO67_12645 [Mycobacteriales bacterium]
MDRPTFTTTQGSVLELRAVAQLEGLLDRHDVRRWLFTDVVRIQSMAVARSHPVLRLNTRHLMNDSLALQTYMHEQLHWWLQDLPGTEAAIEEVSVRWPEPPGMFEGGAANPFSTWLHLVLCPLEVRAAEEVLGNFTMPDVYTWIFQRILEDRPWFDDLLSRHDLSTPSTPPEPQRWPVSLDAGARFYSTDPQRDAVLLQQLGEVYRRCPSLVLGEIEVAVDSSSDTTMHPGLRIGGEGSGDVDALAVQYAFLQAVVFLGTTLAGRAARDDVPEKWLELVAGDPYPVDTLIAGALALPRLDGAARQSLSRTALGERLSPLLPHLDELDQLMADIGLRQAKTGR